MANLLPILLLGAGAAVLMKKKKKKSSNGAPSIPEPPSYHNILLQLTEGDPGWSYRVDFLDGHFVEVQNSGLTREEAEEQAIIEIDKWGDPGPTFHPEGAEIHIYWDDKHSTWRYEARANGMLVAGGPRNTPRQAMEEAKLELEKYKQR